MSLLNNYTETCPTPNVTVSLNDTCEGISPKFNDAHNIVATTAGGIISLFGTAFNAITILSLLTFKRTRVHVTTPFIISLATADLLFSMITLPLLITKFYHGDWVLGNGLCQFFPVIFYGNSAATIFSLMSVTINRCLMIYNPGLSDKIFTRRNSKLIIGLCWIVPLILMTPSWTRSYGQHGMDCKSRSCTILEKNCKSPKNIFFMCAIVVPSLVLIITNLMIYLKVKEIRKNLERQMTRSSVRTPPGLKEKEQKLTKMMGLIFLCFSITYFPGTFIKLGDGDIDLPIMHVFCYVLNWISVLINPTIYVATQERYRHALGFLFAKIFSKNNKENVKFKHSVLMSKMRHSVMSESQ